jgi:hypothetical protein
VKAPITHVDFLRLGDRIYSVASEQAAESVMT